MNREPAELLKRWGLRDAESIRESHGANNLTYPLRHRGRDYFLRVYQNTSDRERLLFEFELLGRLSQGRPSFAVPAPLPTRDGPVFVEVESDRGMAIVVLFASIPGRHPREENVDDYGAAGRALAELDQLLSCLEVEPPASALAPFGRLGAIHPLIRDPRDVSRVLDLDGQQTQRLNRLVEQISSAAERWYSELPQQLVHRDFDGPNTLMRGGRVSGVLDFEFAGGDLRAIDLAVSLCGFSAPGWRGIQTQEALKALVSAYRTSIELRPEEILALPDLMLLYRLVSLLHRTGRFLAGRSRREAAMLRLQALLDLDDWLREQPGAANNVLTGGEE